MTVNQGTSDNFNKVAVQPDGKIVAVGGAFVSHLITVTIRFNSNGTLDNTFADGGLAYHPLPSNHVYSDLWDVEILPDGRILTGGTFSFNRLGIGEVGYYVQMLRNDGNLDSTFGNQGLERTYFWEPLISNQGFFDAEILPDGNVAITNGTGVRITNFNDVNRYFPQNGNRIDLMPNGNFVVSKDSDIKIYSSQSLITTAANINSYQLTVQPDGKIIISENFAVGTARLRRFKLVGSQGTRLANFGNDNQTDFAVYRPSNKTLYFSRNGEGYFQRATNNQASKIFPEYSRFRVPAHTMWRETLIYWNNGSTNNSQGYFTFERSPTDSANFTSPWGLTNDLPYGGDFNGDGMIDVGVFRPSNGVWYGFTDSFFEQNSPTVQWGVSGDKPVPADYDYDGKTDYAVYRPSTGTWWILRSSDGGALAIRFGIATDTPLTGDFDGDGKADLTVYRASEGNWYQLLTTEGFRVVRFGLSTDYPVPGDYDGDGKHDIAVFRDGLWYLLQSTQGFKVVYFGVTGDMPIAVRYDQ